MAKAKAARAPKQVIKERTKFEWVLLILLLLLAYLLLAIRYGWWPAHNTSSDLGTAFYSTTKPAPKASVDSSGAQTASTDSSGSGGSTVSNGSNGTNGSNGSNGSNGGNTTTPTTPSTSSSSIISFAAGVNTGTTKQEIEAKANGLNQSCAVIVNATVVGKQEVCTYTEGDKIVTVTYLNDRVVSASRTGF
jgi:hypothetical protein